MNRDISIARFSTESNSSFLLRLALGTLAGLIIGWFGFLLPGQSVVASIPPMALAFLVGYNIEIVFSLMDRLIGKYTRPDEGQRDAEDETEEDETEPDSPTTA